MLPWMSEMTAMRSTRGARYHSGFFVLLKFCFVADKGNCAAVTRPTTHLQWDMSKGLFLLVAFLLPLGLAQGTASPPTPCRPPNGATAKTLRGDKYAQRIALGIFMPGYGGYFYDRDGVLTVYVREKQRGAALAKQKCEIRALLELTFSPRVTFLRVRARRNQGHAVTLPPGGIRLIGGRYGLRQLYAWMLEVGDLFSVIPKANNLNFDVRRNRLILTLAPGFNREGVERELAKLSVPREVVVLEVGGEDSED